MPITEECRHVNLAARQQCTDLAERYATMIFRMLNELGEKRALAILGANWGHCHCQNDEIEGVLHKRCCKCGDQVIR